MVKWMEIKSRDEILKEIIDEGKSCPEGWRAAAQWDDRLHAAEYYILHPSVGLYELKEYQVNPFLTRGVGAKVARKLDERVSRVADKRIGDFAILELNHRLILEALEKEIPLAEIFAASAEGKHGVHIPVRGSAHAVSQPLSTVRKSFATKQRAVDAEFRKLLNRDGLTKAYM